MSGLVELRRIADPMSVEIARGFLESHGIPAICFDTGMNIADSAAFAIPVRLMVHGDDRAEAERLLTAEGIG